MLNYNGCLTSLVAFEHPTQRHSSVDKNRMERENPYFMETIKCFQSIKIDSHGRDHYIQGNF